MYEDNTRNWYIKGKELLENIDKTNISEDEAAIWYIGQCGFIIKRQSILYIDPVLNNLSDENGNTIRWYEMPYAPEEVKADYVLCTHEHIDHMAMETLQGIYSNNKQVKYIIPGACRDILLAWGIAEEQIIGAVSGNQIDLPGIRIIPISTAHPKHYIDKNGMERTLAYRIEYGQISILHLGDTYLTKRLVDDLKKYSDTDVMLVPINGIDFFREQENIIGNMSVREAAILSKELNVDLTIPMHFDMIKGNTVNPLNFIEELWKIDSGMKFSIPVLGERIIYKRK